jgi:hypothetical protein
VSVDLGRAWEIARGARLADHHPDCAYQRTIGVLLCDCVVLTGHPEYASDVLHGRGGAVRTVG